MIGCFPGILHHWLELKNDLRAAENCPEHLTDTEIRFFIKDSLKVKRDWRLRPITY